MVVYTYFYKTLYFNFFKLCQLTETGVAGVNGRLVLQNVLRLRGRKPGINLAAVPVQGH